MSATYPPPLLAFSFCWWK